MPPLGSRCTLGPTANDIDCSHQTTNIGGRVVLWQTPLGVAPAGGWPIVIIYQGSLLSPDGSSLLAPHGMWQVTASDGAADGLFADYVLTQLTTQTTVIERLLDGGYAVLTPTADSSGFAWDTNLPPWLFDWPPAPDNQFLDTLFAVIGTGQLGPLSTTRWYATGVSSGGYMTSRMAVSYDGRFRALAIAAGSYATCAGGGVCVVPALPDGSSADAVSARSARSAGADRADVGLLRHADRDGLGYQGAGRCRTPRTDGFRSRRTPSSRGSQSIHD